MQIGVVSFSLNGKTGVKEALPIDGSVVIVIDHPAVFFISYDYTGNETSIDQVSAMNRGVNGSDPMILGWNGTLQYTGLDIITLEPMFWFTGYIKTDLTGRVDINCNTL